MASSAALDAGMPADRPTLASWGGGRSVLLAWLLCCAILLWLFRHDLTALSFRDTDDALRLLQVRDWLNGQSFFDVNQYRVNPPFGGPMHWSRIPDFPIAALILLARPWVGYANAEIFACTVVPLLLLGATAWALHRMAKLIAGANVALGAVALLLSSPSILIQFMPLRIDHHGWQIMMGTLAVVGLFDDKPGRGGSISGLALALWLQISTEALPYVALLAGVIGIRFLLAPAQSWRFGAFALTLGSAALLFLIILKGWQGPAERYCDVLSAPFIWPLLTFSVTTGLGFALVGSSSLSRRLLVVALAASASIMTFAMVGGSCVSGDPFKALGPFAYKYWYLQIMEGRPIWEQDAVRGGVIVLPPLIGLLSACLAARAAPPASEERTGWLVLAALIVGTAAIGCMVMRALSLAHLITLPATAWLILQMFRRVQTSSRSVVRVIGSAMLMIFTPAGICTLWVAVASTNVENNKDAMASCQTPAALYSLALLPPATVFAPIDMGPAILLKTHHKVIATGHHRNASGITAVIKGYMADPKSAETLIRRLSGGRGAAYVVSCDSLNEFLYYAKISPDGLGAALSKGHHPDWLRPISSKGPLHIYRVLPEAGAKRSATPFMQ